MAVDPLIPYADTVTTGVGDGSGNGAISTVDPFSLFPLSPQVWQEMDPQSQWNHIAEIVAPGVDDDDDEDEERGNFSPGARLDNTQIIDAPSYQQPPRGQFDEWVQEQGSRPGTPKEKIDTSTDFDGVDESALSPEQKKQLAIVKAQPIKAQFDRLDRAVRGNAFPGYLFNPDNSPKKYVHDYPDGLMGELAERADKLFGLNDDRPQQEKPVLVNEGDGFVGGAAKGEVIGVPGDSSAYSPTIERTGDSPSGTPTSLMPKAVDPRPALRTAGKILGIYDREPERWTHVSDDPSRVHSILQVARSMVDGSRSPENLIQAAYAAAGIDLPDLPDFQTERADRVAIKDLKPGDLVRWDGPYAEPKIGLYVDNGKVIEKGFGEKRASVRDVSSMDKGSTTAYRMPSRSSSSTVTLSSSQRRVVNNAVSAVVKAISGIFSDISRTPSKSSSGSSSSKSSSGSSSSRSGSSSGGSSSKSYYGSEKKNTGNSSQKYSGIGATK